MTCDHAQKQLLSGEHPEFSAVDVDAHLTSCQVCRDFQRQLVTLEANVARVPVPPSQAKARLLGEILGQSVSAPRILKLPAAKSTGRWLPTVKWAGAAAAAVIFIASGIWLGSLLTHTEPEGQNQAQGTQPTPKSSRPKDPFSASAFKTKKDDKQTPPVTVPPVLAADSRTLVASLMDCNLKMAEAETAQERTVALVEMADVLQSESRLLGKSAAPAQIDQLAGLYKLVNDTGMLPSNRDLPIEPRIGVAQNLDDRARDLQRDRLLIQVLVDGGVNLAAADDPLDRADCCNRMADKFAQEIKKSMLAKDAPRAAYLGEQMEMLMVQGVAPNLNLAWSAMEPNSLRQPQLARVGAEAASSAKIVVDEINRHPTFEPARMKSTIQAMNKGKSAVEKALKTKTKAKNDKGKKGKLV